MFEDSPLIGLAMHLSFALWIDLASDSAWVINQWDHNPYTHCPLPSDLFMQKMVTTFIVTTPGNLYSFVWPSPESLCLTLVLLPPALHHKVVCIWNIFTHIRFFIKISNVSVA
jgi:hypothetical protein